jgi:DNA-binding SARP family transcriptional activator
VLRNPYHPALPEWIEKGLDVFKTTPESAVAMRILPPTIFLYLLQGDLISAENLINEFKQSVHERTSPMGTLIFCSVYAFYCWSSGRFEHCLEIADTALELQRQTGIHVNFPQCHFAVGALNTGDVELAEKMLLRVAPSLLSYGYWSKAFYHVVAGWIALLKKDTLRLKCHAMDGLRAGERAGCPMTLPVENLLCALGHHVGGEKEYADFHLKKALNLSRRFQVRQVEFSCLLVMAEFALASGNHSNLTRALKASFELGRTYEYVTAYFWRPDVMAELCVQALQHDIEVKYARKLVKYRRLSPRKPPRNIANWPWPFKFRTLGGFSLEIDGEPVIFSGKTQHRPLSVLKYIVAKGGREVPVTRLQDDLWPDFDGDRAVMAFKAALNRLRKLLGNKAAILRNAGSLSFNEQQCWTDTWAFEYVTGEVESFLDRPDSPRQAEHLLDRLLTLYRGPFLPDEQVPWAIQVRHGLALRFVDLVQRLALVIVDAGDTECAIAILNKALPMAPVEASANQSMIELLHHIGMMPQANLLIEHAPHAMLG